MRRKLFVITIFWGALVVRTHANDPLLWRDMDALQRDKTAAALYEKVRREYGRHVDVNGIRLAYLDFGPKEGTPLIWSHINGGSSYEILNVKDGLIAAGYRVIAIDYRGHGETRLTFTPYNTSLYHIADDINALMDHLNLAKAIVGGLGRGAWVATAFYDTYPKRTLGLLLEDGGAYAYQQRVDDMYVKEGGRYARWPPYHELLLKELEFTEVRYNTRLEAVTAWAGDVGRIPSVELMARYYSLFRQEADGRWVCRTDFAALSIGDAVAYEKRVPSRAPLMARSQDMMLPLVIFRNLDVPVYIIDPVADEDWYIVSDQYRELKALHPRLVVHEIYKNTPHMAHFTRPERFVDSAKRLLKSVNNILPKQ